MLFWPGIETDRNWFFGGFGAGLNKSSADMISLSFWPSPSAAILQTPKYILDFKFFLPNTTNIVHNMKNLSS